MSRKETLREAMSRRVLLLDGAMGTEIQRRGLGGGNNDMLCVERPEVIADIHRSYLEAGADVVTTCTFNAQRVSQADYNTTDRVAEINAAGARIAVEEARRMSELTPERPRYAVGSVGPTNKILSFNRDLTFDELEDAYFEQMAPLIREGVDGLLIETIVDTLNAKAAARAARRAMDAEGREVEILLSMTVADASGRTLSGQTIEAFTLSMAHAKPLSVGLNCSFGAAALLPYLRQMRAQVERLSPTDRPLYVTVHPNAGLPDELGAYNDTPEKMVGEMARYLDEGLVNMIGGCCGTTPAHIKAMRALIDKHTAFDNHSPAPEARAPRFAFAGLEPVDSSAAFVNVGERCNVAGSRKFLRLIKEGQYDEALAIARKQVDDGAMMLDINMDDGMLDAKAEMCRFVTMIADDPAIARVPLMIDSSRFEVIEAALRHVQGKCVVNSISLKEGEDAFLDHARTLRSYGAAAVVMAFDEQGQATTYERRVEICARAYRLLVDEAGFNPGDIIFDPNILTVATGMAEHLDYANDFVRATRWIRENLPGAHVSGGLSNLSFAFRGNNYLREAMHAVFLYRAIAEGMDMAIMNPATAVAYEDIPTELRAAIEDVLFEKRDLAATERLIEIAAEQATVAAQQAASGGQQAADVAPTTPEQRLREALVKGDPSNLSADIDEALRSLRPIDIISGPLMEGMNEVGDRFAQGKMFLPQVIKTARTMKAAVEILTPLITSATELDDINAGKRKILVATVKGDVHDIGKNIVAVVLSCNNYEVVDLGVMVPPEQIVETALRERPDIIGLSGLITPSLDAMVETARQLDAAGIDVPLFIGGATTSEAHTRLKIAPVYGGKVIHVRDAAHNVAVANELLGRRSPDVSRQSSVIGRQSSALETSTAGRPVASDDCKRMDIAELRPLIDWRYFYHLWRVPQDSPQGDALKKDAEAMLDTLEADPEMAPLALFEMRDATSTGHSIIIGDEEIATPRQRQGQGRGDRLALCDFIPTQGGRIALFAVTMSPAFTSNLEDLKRGTDDYASILMQSLGDRLAEAAAEYLHREVASKYDFEGIRPAVGYPSLPDQSVIFKLNSMIDLSRAGIRLTDSGAMYPQASIAGFMIKGGRYFDARPGLNE